MPVFGNRKAMANAGKSQKFPKKGTGTINCYLFEFRILRIFKEKGERFLGIFLLNEKI